MERDRMVDLPHRYWGLDPLLLSNVRLFISDVYTMKETDISGVFSFYSHLFSRAEIMGYIVGIKRSGRRLEIRVDDGTGVISCFNWFDDEIQMEEYDSYDLGQLVTVLGKIKTYRQQRQLNVTDIILESDPNSEMLHWVRLKELHQKVYTQPYTLPPGVTGQDCGMLSAKDLKTKLVDTILQNQQRTRSYKFSLETLSREPEIMEIVEEFKAKYPSSTNKDNTTRSILIQAAKTLIKNGLCYRIDEDNYQIICHEANLGEDIKEIIRKRSNDGQNEGVHLQYIMHSLQSMQRYQYVRTQHVKISLCKLEEESAVYCKDEDSYSLM